MMAFPQLASIGTAVSLLSCCVSLAAQTAPAAQPSPWQVTATLSEGINTNVLLALQHPQADETTALQLDLGRTWKGANWSYQAGYHPQAMSFARNRRLDYFAQTYSQDFERGLGPHTQLSWNLDYSHYPERGGAPQAGGAGVAGVAGASQAQALEMVLEGADTTLSLRRQYSLRGSWTLGISANTQGFSPDQRLLRSLPAGTLAPTKSRSYSGTGNSGWDYDLAPGRTLRFSGQDSELWFRHPAQRLRYENVQASLEQALGGGVTLQVGAGPSWNWVLQTASGPGTLPQRSYAANASLMTQLGRNQYGVSWQHSEQVGLVPGGVATDNLALQASRGWGRSWSATGSLGEGHFAGVSGTAGMAGQGQDSVYAAANLAWRIGAGWSLQASGTWTAQTLPLAPGQVGDFRKLQASLSVSYTPEGAY